MRKPDMTPFRSAAIVLIALPMFGNVMSSIDPELDIASERVHERKVAREETLYSRANDAVDEHDWQTATTLYRRVADAGLEHADAALYWLAYSCNRRGLRSDALAAIEELRQKYPKSKWKEDAAALEVEIRQSSGQNYSYVYTASDDPSAQIIALSGMMDVDPEQAMKIGDRILRSSDGTKTKDKVLFVFSQSGDPRAISIVTKTAKDSSKPELQRRAVRYLSFVGGPASKKALTDVYSSTKDVVVRHAVMKAFMTTGDREQLLVLARTEPDIELRGEAVINLAALGARAELAGLYAKETTTTIRKRIIEGLFIGGNSDKLMEIARTEKNPELRATAIRNVAFAGGNSATIASFYDSASDAAVRHAVLDALCVTGATAQLKAIAEKEKDPALRAQINDRLKRLSE